MELMQTIPPDVARRLERRTGWGCIWRPQEPWASGISACSRWGRSGGLQERSRSICRLCSWTFWLRGWRFC